MFFFVFFYFMLFSIILSYRFKAVVHPKSQTPILTPSLFLILLYYFFTLCRVLSGRFGTEPSSRMTQRELGSECFRSLSGRVQLETGLAA